MADDRASSTSVTRRGLPLGQVVDPLVSRAKFDREVDALRRHEADYRRQGWFVLRAEFPAVELALTVPQLRPAPTLFGIELDFTNYDVDPPSVRIVNPWTKEALCAGELLTALLRLAEVPAAAPEEEEQLQPPVAPANGDDPMAAGEVASPPADANVKEAPNVVRQPVPLLQAWTPDSSPFLCLRGVREYHRHPAHTGDSWLLHRRRGEGTLAAILSAIHEHGVAPIKGYIISFQMEAKPGGNAAFVQKVTARINGFVNVMPDGSAHSSHFA